MVVSRAVRLRQTVRLSVSQTVRLAFESECFPTVGVVTVN
jgi:hypothetical protein